MRPVPELRPAQEARFWSKVDAEGDCWLWTGALQSSGYGNLSLDKKWYVAHRVAYAILVGNPPSGVDLDHLCRNRRCVNPDHLEPVTRSTNLRRGVGPSTTSLRAAASSTCKRGHEYGDLRRASDGARLCRTCINDRRRERRRSGD